VTPRTSALTQATAAPPVARPPPSAARAFNPQIPSAANAAARPLSGATCAGGRQQHGHDQDCNQRRFGQRCAVADKLHHLAEHLSHDGHRQPGQRRRPGGCQTTCRTWHIDPPPMPRPLRKNPIDLGHGGRFDLPTGQARDRAELVRSPRGPKRKRRVLPVENPARCKMDRASSIIRLRNTRRVGDVPGTWISSMLITSTSVRRAMIFLRPRGFAGRRHRQAGCTLLVNRGRPDGER